jgi:hypothetical protein
MKSKWFTVTIALSVFVAATVVGMIIKSNLEAQSQLEAAAERRGVPVDLYADIQERFPRIEKEQSLTDSDREAITRYATSDNPEVRRYAIVFTNLGLHKTAPHEVTAFAEKFVDDEAIKVRSTAYMILYKRDPEGWEKYRSKIESDPAPQIRALVDLFEGESKDENKSNGS